VDNLRDYVILKGVHFILVVQDGEKRVSVLGLVCVEKLVRA
jgi:hypothetical protein